jgi:hypothetical protein
MPSPSRGEGTLTTTAKPVRLLLGTLFALGVAALVGLGATWLALTQGQAFGGLSVGAWSAWPRHGTASIDPYARAMVARSGQLPVGSGDGIAFQARHDDSGAPLDGRCDIVVSGMTPQARYWTITLYDPDGALVANSVQRHGFTSHEVVRRANGSFEITVSPRSRAGNWLPTGSVERYLLVLRLYDTPIGVATRGREVTMPAITRRNCP